MELLVPIAALIVDVVVQVAAFRLGGRMLRSIVAGFLAGLVSVASLEAYSYASYAPPAGEFVARAAANMLAFSSLGYCYFHFVNLGETARRVRLMRELYDRPGGLSPQEVLGRYSASDIVEKRLGRLLANGQVEFRDGRYFTGRRTVLLIARLMVVFKLLVLGRRSEFDAA